MNTIVYHVRKRRGSKIVSINSIDNQFKKFDEKLNKDVILQNLTDKKDIIDYILSKTNNRMRNLFVGGIEFTLAFSYDETTNTMYCGWSKCLNSIEKKDKYSKKIAYDIAVKRCERLKAICSGKKKDTRYSVEPREIHDAIKNDYFQRAKKYFKGSDENTTLMVY